MLFLGNHKISLMQIANSSVHDLNFPDRQQRDLEYNARATVPDFSIFVQTYADKSLLAKERLPSRLDLAYGAGASEKFDIFYARDQVPTAPTLIYIHGGYWRSLSRKDSAFMAQALTEKGVNVIAIEYALAPEVSMELIVDQCRRALVHFYQQANEYGLDNTRLHIAGSSAGGHLCGMLVAAGWHADYGVPEDVVKSACMLSGLFDIRPLCDSHINEWMRLNTARAALLSPLLLEPLPSVAMLLAVGALETMGFKRQTLAYADLLMKNGNMVDVLEVEERHHFDIVLDLDDAAAELTQALLRLILPALN